MTKATMTISAHVSWWTKPFVVLAYLVALPFWWAVDLDTWLERCSGFAVRHGLKITTG